MFRIKVIMPVCLQASNGVSEGNTHSLINRVNHLSLTVEEKIDNRSESHNTLVEPVVNKFRSPRIKFTILSKLEQTFQKFLHSTAL